jgi:hypothetical protein
MNGLRHLGLVWAGVLFPSIALACATCSDPEDASNGAFLVSTIFLSFLPLAAIGGLVYGVWRHMNRSPEAPSAIQQ